MENTRELFIKNITRRRADLGFTQSQAAERVGITLGTYQKYEYGTAFPSPDTIDELAKALNCRVSDLLSSDEGARTTELDRASRILAIQSMLLKLSDDDMETVETMMTNILEMSENSPLHKAKES